LLENSNWATKRQARELRNYIERVKFRGEGKNLEHRQGPLRREGAAVAGSALFCITTSTGNQGECRRWKKKDPIGGRRRDLQQSF